MLIIIRNKIFPFKGYKAMCVYPFLFVRKDAKHFGDIDRNHEMIHARQQLEMSTFISVLLFCLALVGCFSMWWVLISPFGYYALYLTEYIIRILCSGFRAKVAYRSISYEQEAYSHQNDMIYLKRRTPFASVLFLFR
jgi:hypothetical protein